MANTREMMGEAACLDALVADTLTSFEDDGVTKVGARALRYKTTLTNVTLGQCKSVNTYGLADCTALTMVDMLGTGTIDAWAFTGDTSLTSLILRGGTMETLANANAFNLTPIVIDGGAIYVPTALVDTYKADANWSSFLIADIADYPLNSYETITDSWSTIIANCANGTTGFYSVGDTKAITIDGTEYMMKLVAKDADVLATDGVTTAPTTWVMNKRYYGEHLMNSTSTTSGGWGASSMRTWLSDTVLPTFPSEVQNAIKEVKKYSDTYEGGAIVHDQETADKLWIPSAREMFGGTNYEQTGPTYSPLTASASAKIKYNASGHVKSWWLRSAYNENRFRYVGENGNSFASNANYSYGICIGFCI